MSTICFDIKRVDDNYVCIHHCNMNKFEYEYHLALSFYPRTRKGKDHWWLKDNKYRYVWIVTGIEIDTGIEKIIWACNDKLWLNHSIKWLNESWQKQYSSTRVIKLPFESISKSDVMYQGEYLNIYTTADLKDKYKLYCPIKLNEKHHIYTDHYEEIEPEIEKIGDYEIKHRNFKWIPPKMLGEE